jgi:hypothetical protein
MYHLLLLVKKNKKVRFLVLVFITILTFATIYWSLGSSSNFNFANNKLNDNNDAYLTFLDALYFTIGTHTTIGYGDITPKSQLMRGIVSIQIMLLIIKISFANL